MSRGGSQASWPATCGDGRAILATAGQQVPVTVAGYWFPLLRFDGPASPSPDVRDFLTVSCSNSSLVPLTSEARRAGKTRYAGSSHAAPKALKRIGALLASGRGPVTALFSGRIPGGVPTTATPFWSRRDWSSATGLRPAILRSINGALFHELHGYAFSQPQLLTLLGSVDGVLFGLSAPSVRYDATLSSLPEGPSHVGTCRR